MWDILIFIIPVAHCLTLAQYSRRYLLNFKYGNVDSPTLSVFPFPELLARLFGSTLQDYKDRQDYVSHIDVPDSYHGPRLQFPLTFTDIDLLVEAFKQQQASGSRYCPDSCT